MFIGQKLTAMKAVAQIIDQCSVELFIERLYEDKEHTLKNVDNQP